jgi:hypothetical protein
VTSQRRRGARNTGDTLGILRSFLSRNNPSQNKKKPKRKTNPIADASSSSLPSLLSPLSSPRRLGPSTSPTSPSWTTTRWATASCSPASPTPPPTAPSRPTWCARRPPQTLNPESFWLGLIHFCSVPSFWGRGICSPHSGVGAARLHIGGGGLWASCSRLTLRAASSCREAGRGRGPGGWKRFLRAARAARVIRSQRKKNNKKPAADTPPLLPPTPSQEEELY